MKYILSLLFAVCLFIPTAAQALNYNDGDTALTGYLATPENNADKAPIIMIVHQWKGLGEYEKKRADMLADLGYVAFAIDMYGRDVRPATTEAAKTESGKYKNDLNLAHSRLQAALQTARNLNVGDPDKIAIIGYCFGGTMALEAARMGADVEGVVSFHGGLGTSRPIAENAGPPEIEVHHGAADPMVSAAEVDAFMQEIESSFSSLRL